MKSAYELERDATVARNRAHLQSLGLELTSTALPEPLTSTVPPVARQHRRRQPSGSTLNAEATRASKRLKSAAPEYSGATIDEGSENDDLPSEQQSPVLAPAPAAPRPPRPAKQAARILSALLEGVRTYVEEHVPDGWALEEREMFGFSMFLVRGNMFVGVGLHPKHGQQLLIRVSKETVEATLALNLAGVSRCTTVPFKGGVFPGTVMIEPAQYAGNEKVARWFDLALEYNATLASKAPKDRVKKAKQPVLPA